MIDWWNSLLIEKQIFYAIGLFSLAVLLFKFSSRWSESAYITATPISPGTAITHTGIGLLTVRTVTAFFVGFGWAGVIMLNHGHSMLAAIAGTGIGLVFLLVTAFLDSQSAPARGQRESRL